jgi:hypothetical protein
MYDPNVGTSGVDWRDAVENRPVASDWFRKQTKIRHGGRELTLRANDRFVALDVRGDFAVKPFSVNRPDRVLGISQRSSVRIGAKSRTVFSQTATETRAVVAQRGIGRAIEGLELSADESVHVYANGVTVYLRPPSLQRVLAAIAAVVVLADELPTGGEPTVDFSDLPSDLASLSQLATRWGIADDADREDRLARASTRSLQRLVGAVMPHLVFINAHLDSFGDRAVPESAAALGALAECAVEAQLILDHRGRRAVPNKRLQPTAARKAAKRASRRRG